MDGHSKHFLEAAAVFCMVVSAYWYALVKKYPWALSIKKRMDGKLDAWTMQARASTVKWNQRGRK